MQKCKNAKTQKTLHKWEVFYKMEQLTFCVITFEPSKFWILSAPQNDSLNFSFVKDIRVVGKKKARNSRKTDIYQSQILGISPKKLWIR